MGIYQPTHFVNLCTVGVPVTKRHQKGREENKEEEEEEEEEGRKKRGASYCAGNKSDFKKRALFNFEKGHFSSFVFSN